jgi:hypothetical protein
MAASAQLEAFMAMHGQPLVTRGERMGEPCFTGSATREFLALLRRVDARPIGMEIWRWVDGDLDIDGPATWYSLAGMSLPEIHDDAARYLDQVQPGPNDRLTVQFE